MNPDPPACAKSTIASVMNGNVAKRRKVPGGLEIPRASNRDEMLQTVFLGQMPERAIGELKHLGRASLHAA
jgi:hypothetical protein